MPLPLGALALMGGASLGGNILGGILGAKGAKDAARIQSRSADKAMGLLSQFYGQGQKIQQPFLDIGSEGLGQFSNMVMGGDFLTDVPEFEYSDFSIEDDPGYQFELGQGQQAIERMASARGASLGGGTLKDLLGYSQGLASTRANQAYNRYAGDRAFDYGLLSDLYGRDVQQKGIQSGLLQALTGVGERAAGRMTDLSTGLGSSLAGLTTQKGAVQAGGAAGSSRALANMFSGIGSDLGGLGSLYMLTGGFGGPAAMSGGTSQALLAAPEAYQGLGVA